MKLKQIGKLYLIIQSAIACISKRVECATRLYPLVKRCNIIIGIIKSGAIYYIFFFNSVNHNIKSIKISFWIYQNVIYFYNFITFYFNIPNVQIELLSLFLSLCRYFEYVMAPFFNFMYYNPNT